MGRIGLDIIAFCVIILAVRARKMVDLTYQYNDNKTVFYPATSYYDMKFKIMERGWWDLPSGRGKVWLEDNEFSMPEHLGTHMDAPSHLSYGPGTWRLHQIPIDRFVGDGVVIDISHKADLQNNPNALLEVSDIQMWEEKYGTIKDGSIILVNSGWDKYWGDELKFLGNDKKDLFNLHFPGVGKEAAHWLVDERQISGLGVDTVSLDAGNSLNFPAHLILLSANIYGIENVKNLGKLPPCGSRVNVFPIKLFDGSGGPTRVIAEFETDGPHGPEQPNAAMSHCVNVMTVIGLIFCYFI